MADIEVNVSSNQPCENDTPGVFGLYQCTLHHISQKAIKRTIVPVGELNPLSVPLGDVVSVLLNRTRERVTPYLRRHELPINQLIGLTVIRACVGNEEHADGTSEPWIHAERVAAFAFADNVNEVQPSVFGPLAVDKRITPGGLVHLAVGRDEHRRTKVTAVHLPVTPEESSAYPVTAAVPSFGRDNKSIQPWIALHPMPDEQRYVETLVSREELLASVSMPE